MDIPYLSGDALSGLGLSTAQIIAGIERVIVGARQGTVWAAPKAVVTPPNDKRYMMAALAAMDDPSLLAVKTVVLNPDNPDHGLPQINGLVTVLHSDTGLPAAILDGNWVTAVRTAGLSVTAAKYMAQPDAATIGFVGCGVQASSHLDAFAATYPLRDALYFGRGEENQTRLAAHARQLGLAPHRCASAREVLAEADIVVTTVTHTGGATPFLDARDMKPGGFAAIVDLAAPWIRDSFSALDQVIIDDLEQERALPNKLCDPHIVRGDLSGLVLGSVQGRTAASDRNAFVFRGHALGDLALAVLAFEAFREDNRAPADDG